VAVPCLSIDAERLLVDVRGVIEPSRLGQYQAEVAERTPRCTSHATSSTGKWNYTVSPSLIES
jgi:hypothetical protein